MRGEYINDDWRNVLPSLRSKQFDIAIVDPPYFTGPDKRGYYGQSKSTTEVKRVEYNLMDWRNEIPDLEYYEELCRVSRHQIIWGINYFPFAHKVVGRIVWDKVNQNSSFSDCEIASSSLHTSVRLFRYMWNGMMQGKSILDGHVMQGNKSLNEKRIHPTQKPINLYKWLVLRYLTPGQTVLDTHVGSASSLIAYEDAGLSYLGIEKDKSMYSKSFKRLQREINPAQRKLVFNH